MLRILILIILSACSSVPKTAVQDWRNDCQNGVCLYVTRTEGTQSEVFEVSSELTDPITFTLRVEFSRASAVPIINKGQITKVVKPNERIEILSLNSDGKNDEIHFQYQYWWKIGPQRPKHEDEFNYRLPFKTGEKIKVIQSNYGPFSHYDPDEFSTDFMVPEGTPIHAARGGKVIDAKSDSNEGGIDDKYLNSANYIRILHPDGTRASYLHLQKNGVLVKKGEEVKEGQLIGRSGNTGYSSRPHLHFTVGKNIDGRVVKSIEVFYKSRKSPRHIPKYEEELEVID